MKKKNLANLLMMALAVLCSISLTACGGDDDDTPGRGSGSSGSTTEYVEPYLNWDATADQVRADMANDGWQLLSEANNILQYTHNRYPGVVVTLGVLYSQRLTTSQVAFQNVPASFLSTVVNEVKTRYNVTWEEAGNSYYGKGIANGKAISVSIIHSTGTVIVQFIKA